jgi:type IV pilus assembly protein PilB
LLLSQILQRHGAITKAKLAEAPTDPVGDEQFVRLLLDSSEISINDLLRARAEKHRVKFVDLADFQPSRSAILMISGELARRHQMLPLEVKNGELHLAMTRPNDIIALDDARAACGMNITPVLVERVALAEAIERTYRMGEALGGELGFDDAEETTQDEGAESSASDAPIVRFVHAVIDQAIRDRASDIHIEPGEHDLRIRYRIDGVLHEMQRESKRLQSGVISRIKILSDIDISERRKPQDGRMTFGAADSERDIRVATLPTVWGEKIILRILDKVSGTQSLPDLGFSESNLEVFERQIKKPHGMILVTGPTGSGKTTTLYTALGAISTPEINVITVEDPVEARIEGINQIQVNPRAGLTFASALRSILRADPDVVLVGEIRDKETAQIAVEASLTGHLVLSTLHTNSAAATVTRLIELGVEPFLVASSISAVVAQRLARRLCLRCRRATEIPAALAEAFEAESKPTLFAPVGCNACARTGFRGRLAVHEVLEVSEEIAQATLNRASASELEKIAVSQGMLTLRQDGLAKVAQGLTSVEEIFRVID